LEVLIVVAMCCSDWLGAQQIGPITVEQSSRETAVRVEANGCKSSLEWMPAESLLRYRNDCKQSLDVKFRIFSVLADKLAQEHEVFEEADTLAIGRLSVTFPELARQLSLAAYKSPKWDAKRGRAAGSGRFDYGADNAFFRDIANELKLFGPLDEALKVYGLSLRAVSVEKVLAGTPKQLPFGDWLIEQGVPLTAKLPFDGQMWLRLERTSKTNSP
jgi:hypothetical protein